MKHSVYNTIESLSFAFNPKTELNLARFVQNCLMKEGIKAKLKKEGYLYFCNYNQMLKFYLNGLLDLHNDKKEKFEKLIKNAKFYLHFKDNYKVEFNSSQHKLAKEIGLSQAALSKYRTENKISLNLANKLLNPNFIKNISYISVSNNKIKYKQSIEYIIRYFY